MDSSGRRIRCPVPRHSPGTGAPPSKPFSLMSRVFARHLDESGPLIGFDLPITMGAQCGSLGLVFGVAFQLFSGWQRVVSTRPPPGPVGHKARRGVMTNLKDDRVSTAGLIVDPAPYLVVAADSHCSPSLERQLRPY